MPNWLVQLWEGITPAWYGAALSTLLAAIKIGELIRDRARVHIDAGFASAPEAGNEIHIRNLATRPQILVFWEVFYATQPLLFRKEEAITSAYDFDGTTIKPGETHTLRLTDGHWFSTTPSALDGRAVYIRLHFAGRKPTRRKIYPF